MGRLSTLYALVGASFIGGVALAQQGLVAEPWRKAPAPGAAPLAKRDLPGSGLPPVGAALPTPRKSEAAAEAPRPSSKWSPPVVELLVDPWAKPTNLAVAPKPRWVPSSPEIIDPWPEDARAEPPRIATRPAEVPPSTIF